MSDRRSPAPGGAVPGGASPAPRFGRPLSDPPLSPDEKLDIDALLDGLKHYRPRREGWTWRRSAA